MARVIPMNHSLAMVTRAPRSMSLAIYDREEVSIDEDKESMDKGNNVRYLKINWIDVVTECQVQSRIICYQGSSAEMIRNPKEQYWISIR
jgi:hypothetical protein